MTIATEYYNFQRMDGRTTAEAYPKWDAKDWDHRQPAMNVLYDYLKVRWGGSGLGSYGRRPIRGSSTVPSSHGTGGTFDWRWAPTGSRRTPNAIEALDLLINYSKELGVQFIGDYYGCRIWIANRDLSVYPDRWRTQTPSSSGMGQTGWAQWFHVELHPSVFTDGRPIAEKLGFDPEVVNDLPEFNPAAGKWGLWPVNSNKPAIRVGSVGDVVRYAQGVMKLKAGQTWLTVDGAFGNITKTSVINLQRFFNLTPDGVIGPVTWRTIDYIATQ